MVSIKISRGKFPRPGPDTSALRMLERLTAVNPRRRFVKSEELDPTIGDLAPSSRERQPSNAITGILDN